MLNNDDFSCYNNVPQNNSITHRCLSGWYNNWTAWLINYNITVICRKALGSCRSPGGQKTTVSRDFVDLQYREPVHSIKYAKTSLSYHFICKNNGFVPSYRCTVNRYARIFCIWIRTKK